MHRLITLSILTCIVTCTLISCNPKTTIQMPKNKGKIIQLDAFLLPRLLNQGQ